MKELTITAAIENIPTVTDFVTQQLEDLDCSAKTLAQIAVAIDERFSNIVRYAYNPEVGAATVRVEVVEKPLAVTVTFIDGGRPYDPLWPKKIRTLHSLPRSVGSGGWVFIW